MTLRTIDRISTPSAEVFFEDYVIKRRPVVISDLFSGQAIDHVRTLDDAIAAFGRAELLVQPEYTKRLASDVPRAEQVMTFQDYWNVIRNNPQSDLVCTEYEIPAPVMQLFTLPDMCLARTTQGEEILQLPKKYGDHDLVSNMFMAGKGNKAHLHYDGDQRQVLLYQVFGEKEVVLFQPSRGSAISKAHSTAQFLSTDLNQMSRSELLEYIDKIDGYHTVIKPGEAIYMPMLIWHHLNYSEDAMSFNIRFGRNSYGRFFCVDNFHRDYYLQNFASLLANEAHCSTVYKEAIHALIDEYTMPANSLEAKLQSIRGVLRSICARHCPDARADEFYSLDAEEHHIRVVLEDVRDRMIFLPPEQIRNIRPMGGLSDSQRRHIVEAAAARGYGGATLNHIVYNRVGKQAVERLTKPEASVILQYLKCPGSKLN